MERSGFNTKSVEDEVRMVYSDECQYDYGTLNYL